MPAYRLPSTYDRPPLRRRASGLALALGINVLLLIALLTLGKFAPVAEKTSRALVVDLLPKSHSAERQQRTKAVERPKPKVRPVPKPPPIILPVKPTIAPPPNPRPGSKCRKDEMAAADVGNLPKVGAGSGGDSEVVGKGPHGETLYNAEWAREPTDAELRGYLPHNLHDGWGLIMCKTIPGNRVEDCIELGQDPPGSHLASAIRQAAWQFRVRPPRKNGRPLVGEWVRIRIDYTFSSAG